MKLVKNSIILVIVFVALLSAYFFIPKQNSKDENQKVTVKTFDANSIVYITLNNPNAQFVFKKTEKGWEMQKPKKYKIDKVLFNSFIDKFSNLKADAVVEENAQELSKYGLATPSATVTLKANDGKSTMFELGDKKPIGEGYYIKTSDSNTIYSVAEDVAGDFLRSMNEFRDKSIFGVLTDDIAEITLLKNNKEILKFKKDSAWTVKSPDENGKGIETDIKNVADKLSAMKVNEYIVDDPNAMLEQYGLNKPLYTIIVESKDEKPQKLFIGADFDESNYYVKMSNGTDIFTILKDDVSFITKSPKDFIQK